MRKWFLIMAAALVLCSACGKKDTSVNGVTQEAQASSTEAESLYKEGAGYVGEEDYESAIESLLLNSIRITAKLISSFPRHISEMRNMTRRRQS